MHTQADTPLTSAQREEVNKVLPLPERTQSSPGLSFHCTKQASESFKGMQDSWLNTPVSTEIWLEMHLDRKAKTGGVQIHKGQHQRKVGQIHFSSCRLAWDCTATVVIGQNVAQGSHKPRAEKYTCMVHFGAKGRFPFPCCTQ